MYVTGSSSGNYVTGLASGMDTDSIVANLMNAERIPYDEKYQDIQYYEWQIDAYQSVAGTVQTFQEEHFDYLNNESNLLSSSTFLDYSTVASSSAVSAIVVDGNAADAQYSVTVDQIATSASMTSDTAVSKSIQASLSADYEALSGEAITLTLDGTEKTVCIEDCDGMAGIDVNDIQQVIDESFGSGKIIVSDTDGVLSFNTVEGSGSHELALEADDDVMTSLGFEEGDTLSNRITINSSLEEVAAMMATPFTFDEDGMITLTINDVLFEFDGETSLEYMMETINSDIDAGVTMTYDSLKDTFEISADDTGAGKTLTIEESGSSFLSATGMTTVVEGQDAIASVNGEKIVRSSNVFEVDGVSFTVNAVTETAATINIDLDTDVIYGTIVQFVEDYNALIEGIQESLDEERDYDYEPLTEAQKDEMTDDEIEAWEEATKVGILGNDDLLEDMLDDMRIALYSAVKGCGLTLDQIGISTDSYETAGTLYIDETTLKTAIEENPTEVVELFTKQSDSYSGTTSARKLDGTELAVRQEEEGLMYRLYDITESYVSTTSDSSGNKGLLVEKCGFKDDYSELSSSMYAQLEEMETEWSEMEDDLEEKEENYYEKFSYLETYISQMNSQLSMIQSWFS
ncbi:MAG: flagellar filament capping protein FliD [Clostridia bacterium]|nr:flagellar filament capping protein FliD [Clostridia bacterium]